MIDKTSRKETITHGRSSTNEVFTVPFEIENTSDLSVYDASGNLAVEGVNYNVTNYGLPAATANAITVTWVGSTPSGTYTFYRNSTTKQDLSITSGFSTGQVETAFDRIHLAGQNSIRSSNSVLDLDGSSITLVEEPLDNSDASTVRYAQEVYSQKGYICPPQSIVDANKSLYAQSTTSFIWKDPFDIPYPAAASKILKVDGAGVVGWVDPVEYAPVYPTLPQYLSVDSADEAWRTVKQIPSLLSGAVGDTLMYQTGDTYAWETIRWLEPAPDSRNYLYNSTGTGTDGVVGSTTTVEMDAGKCTTLWESNTDGNYGGTWDFYIRSNTGGGQRFPLFEFDCSAYSAATYNYDSIESVKIKFYPSSVFGSTNQTVYIRRLKNTFVEGTGLAGNSYADDGATWEKPSAPGGTDWNWGGGNFNAEKELDYDLPACTFQMGLGAGTETVAGAYSSIDITPLFIDAIRNRSGILRFCMYVPLSATTATTTIRCYANADATNETELEIKYANARKAYWQPWNYHHDWQTSLGNSDQNEAVGGQQHVNSVIDTHIPMGSITNGHTGQGKTVAFNYSSCCSVGSGFYQQNSNTMAAVTETGAIWLFHDKALHTFQYQATGGTARVSTFWLQDE